MAEYPSIGFCGAGRLANVLARALYDAGYPVTAIYSRSSDSAQRLATAVAATALADPVELACHAELILITTPDAAIAAACAQIAAAPELGPRHALIHCSGALSSSVLMAAAERGAQIACLHPVQTFAGVESGLRSLSGISYGLEATEPLRSRLLRLVDDLEGRVIEVQPADRPLYHAAAALVANYSITLFAAAVQLYRRIGLDAEAAGRALLPLFQGTLDSLQSLGLPQALTGPIARGDTQTVSLHLQALQTQAPELLPLYRELGRLAVPLAIARGLDPQAAQRIEQLLEC